MIYDYWWNSAGRYAAFGLQPPARVVLRGPPAVCPLGKESIDLGLEINFEGGYCFAQQITRQQPVANSSTPFRIAV